MALGADIFDQRRRVQSRGIGRHDDVSRRCITTDYCRERHRSGEERVYSRRPHQCPVIIMNGSIADRRWLPAGIVGYVIPREHGDCITPSPRESRHASQLVRPEAVDPLRCAESGNPARFDATPDAYAVSKGTGIWVTAQSNKRGPASQFT
jgi:hypothetical protein